MTAPDSTYASSERTQDTGNHVPSVKRTRGAAETAMEEHADLAAERLLTPSASDGSAALAAATSVDAGIPVAAAPDSLRNVINGSGTPIQPALRADMEQRFGHDFSHVRVHTDADAARSAQDLRADAYTAGRHIAFDIGRYAPGTGDGRRLLAHELTHVVQQDAGSRGAARTVQLQENAQAEDESESKAGSIARAAERGRKQPGDKTRMMLNASEIVYRLIDLFMPDYKDRISGVGYEEQLKQVRVDATRGSLSITVGKAFVLGTTRATLENSALELGSAILAKAPRQSAAKKGILGAMIEQQQRAPGAAVSFEDALKEGASTLHAAGFGMVCGQESGADSNDRYDARDWKEKEGRREILVPKVEPWLAFSRLVRNLGKDVPSAAGGSTRWAFDCFGFVIVNRLYAHWRTLTRGEFNAQFKSLELGINSSTNKEWEKPMLAEKPGDKPYIAGEVKERGTSGVFEQEKIPVRQSWNDLIDKAPIGSQITWGNQDAKTKCTADPNLSFCAFMFENTTKVGNNQYSAHPFGVVSREFIEDEMAKAVLNAEGKPVTTAAKQAYIKRHVYISGIRYPKPKPQESTSI